MPGTPPPELARLLAARDPTAREAAWVEFARVHTRLLLHVARSVGRDHDAAMDAYAYLLERLRENDYRRLQAYAVDGRSKFTTWLVVVARRLCVDHHRERYGRLRDGSPERVEEHQARRRLADLIAVDLDAATLSVAETGQPDAGLLARERAAVIAAALETLDAADRLLLRLRFEDDLSAREIAQLVGLPTPFHVYRRLNALRVTLRHALRRRGIEEAEA
jgi:RNA polymerase sigma factor (sigma-70 family)